MAVVLVLDFFAIDAEEAVIVEPTEASINATRKKIDQHLTVADNSLLRVRLNSSALYRRFSDYEGLNGVLPTHHLSPRVLLAQILRTALPAWLSDELIVSLDLLQRAEALEVFETSKTDVPVNEPFETKLLKSCDADLLSGDISQFIAALARQNQQFLRLLSIEPVQLCFKRHLTLGLSLNDEVATLLVNELLNATAIDDFLNRLAYQQHLQTLRGFVAQYQLNQALPPKNLPESLLQALPALPLVEDNANNLPEKYVSALQAIERKILNKSVSPAAICDCLVDWSQILSELSELIDANYELITDELLAKLQSFSSRQSLELLEQLQQRTRSYPLLDASANVTEALAWSEGYLDYCRGLFLDKQSPDEAVNLSFSKWLLTQQPRITRSDTDWRYFSKQVSAYLEQAYVVVVIMVDALSALNQDIVLAELAGLNHLNLQQGYLFAPLPTLTEVGKMAVLTGIEANAQNGHSQTEILQNHYQNYLPDNNSLKVIRSWTESSERLNETTQLLVFFENRLDDRLHQCKSFSKHRDDIKPIIKQIKRSIERWRKDAAHLNKDIAFFITADHGMTVTNELYQGQALGKVKERVFKGIQTAESNQDFVSINDYAVPKKRWRLNSDALLTHGGLTPEEVIIPFISLTSNIPQPIKTPLEICLISQYCIRLDNKFWQIECLLSSNTDVSNIQLSFASPFNGKETLDSLRAMKRQTLKLNFNSEHEQEGLTEIQLHLGYKRDDGAYEENNKVFSVEFPPALIEKNSATQSFEDMF